MIAVSFEQTAHGYTAYQYWLEVSPTFCVAIPQTAVLLLGKLTVAEY